MINLSTVCKGLSQLEFEPIWCSKSNSNIVYGYDD